MSMSAQGSHHLLHWKCNISVNALLIDKITVVSCCSSSGPVLKSAALLRPLSAHLPPSLIPSKHPKGTLNITLASGTKINHEI